MATAKKTLQHQQIWKSRRYLTLIHAAVLSAAASSMTLGAPKSAKIVALNKANGSPILSAWLWRSENAASGTGVLAGNTLYFVQDQNLLRALDVPTGKLRWEAKLAQPVAFTPVLSEDKIIAYNRDHLWAFALAGGRALWDAQLPDDNGPWNLTEPQHPTFGEGLVMACSGKQIVGLNAEDGEVQWIYAGQSLRPNQTPIIESDRIYLRTTTPDAPWVRLSVLDGTPLSDEDDPTSVAPTAQADLPAKHGVLAGRIAISADRRTLTLRNGRRACKYQVAAPSIISGIVGETPTAVCIQVVEPGSPASRRTAPLTRPNAEAQKAPATAAGSAAAASASPSATPTVPTAAAPSPAAPVPPAAAPSPTPSPAPVTAPAAK